ncbi:RHS repeat-associated protein [Chitinophaga skermanii]|uniref:RHS repeat-associated protein n=1 Tax=Chitinophaga skermanii TaxID=331697 RepID=A0A327QCF0_9BACT|nr:RHS repeat-associated core domain-containing protein [Chitinophaga skermanii]RAJ02326.1 RHS repeat-associated protein [Chitinophaga skermanii]
MGNVLATLYDRKKEVSANGVNINYYLPIVNSAQDYYPFGMVIPGRGAALLSGGGNGSGGGASIPPTLAVSSRTGNTPREYVASNLIEFVEGFESGTNDDFIAYISDGAELTGNGSGNVGVYGLGGYRYGFNGKENDNEVKGDGNQQDYGMRIYDPRIGKFFSVDPLSIKYPDLAPYQFAANTPIAAIDWNGLEPVLPAKAYKNISLEDLRGASKKSVSYLKGVLKATLDWAERNPWNYSEYRQSDRAKEFGTVVHAVSHPVETISSIPGAIKNWGINLLTGEPEAAGYALGQGLTFAVDIYMIKGLGSVKMSHFEGNSIIRKALNDGVKIIEAVSEDDKAYLKRMGAQATYMENVGEKGSILVGNMVSRPQILEEAFHHFQRMKYGSEYMGSEIVKVRLEIEAQNWLLKIGKREGWTATEIAEIERAKKHGNKV